MFVKRVRLFYFLVIITLLSACSPSQSVEPIASAPLVGPVIPVGEAEVRDLSPTTEVISNCGSGGGTVIKHPSMSVVTNYAVEWEVGGTTGVGVTIGEGVVPGGVNLSSTLEGRYATQLDQGIQQAAAWELPAEPDTVVEYTLMWREVWQPGYVEIKLANESVIRANVRYRTGIQSDIVGKRAENCSSDPIADQPYSTSPPPNPVKTPAPFATESGSNPTLGSNLINNGDFENPLDGSGWEWSDQVSLINGYSNNFGVSSVKTANVTFGWVGLAQEVPARSGTTYSFTAWLYWQNATQVHMKILWFDDSLRELGTTFVMDGIDGSSPGWVKRGGLATALPGTAVARLYFWHGIKDGTTNMPGSELWIDDVIFAELND